MGDLLFASRREGIGRFVFASRSKGPDGLNNKDHVSYCDCFGSLCSGVLIYLRTLLKQSGEFGETPLFISCNVAGMIRICYDECNVLIHEGFSEWDLFAIFLRVHWFR